MLEFEIYESVFAELFGLYLVFFAVLWTVAYTLKQARNR